jgi:G3E family GTPase
MSVTAATQADQKTPVTVLTGFLGSGKTTLLNRILTERHGQKIAVIENEYGEVGIDNDLVIDADEEIFEMNNGCICCTVRGDLIRILGSLMRRKDRFDHILIETTGLADPGPVIQTFFVDDEMQDLLALDGVVTLVDAGHLALHLDDAPEAKEQIAFADVIVLNKIDLVDPSELDALERRIKTLNGAARIHRVQQAAVPIGEVVGVGGFDLSRGLEVRPELLSPSYPFEWLGVYELSAGPHSLVFGTAPDPSVDVLLMRLPEASERAVDAVLRDATIAFSGAPSQVGANAPLVAEGFGVVELASAGTSAPVEIQTAGAYALFTEHGAGELDLSLIDPDGRPAVPRVDRQIAPDHEHDETITSVGITEPGELDPERFNAWLGELLREKGQDIFRMKGVLSIAGVAERFVFQGVHMLFDGRPDRPWGDEPRSNKLIFIGRDLDRTALDAGFRACLA